MKRLVTVTCAFAAALCLGAPAAEAWNVHGFVYCDANGNGVIDVDDLPVAGVRVIVTQLDPFDEDDELTDAAGFYSEGLPEPGTTFSITLDPATLPADAVIILPSPVPHIFTTSEENSSVLVNFLIRSETCRQKACWLTGGGAKFSPITGTLLAEHGPQHNFGGNVNPSCDPDPGEGGQWNHVAHAAKLHFLGTAIQVVRCGNVPGIDPGSESPQTPFNFIEFKGTGTLKGIQGNKVDYGTVHFFARAEDRNEPGSNGAKDGADIDRYFLHVFSDPLDPNGTTLLLVDSDGIAGTVDPVTITDGNLQIHISSCSDPPPQN
jgi:hypothetical protein